MTSRVCSWAASDVGRKREHNEDSFLVDDALGLYAVADGMGGHAAGEIASAAAIEAIKRSIVANAPTFAHLASHPTAEARSEAERAVEQAILEACKYVHALGKQDPSRKGMGTTCAVVVVAGHSAIVGHVGDSRVYLARAESASALTEDHSLAAELLRTGKMSSEEIARSNFKSVLLRTVGVHESVQVDTRTVELSDGDKLLLCSDGLHGYFDAAPSLPALLSGEPATLPERLVAFANQQGGEDNVTAVVALIGAPAEHAASLPREAKERGALV